MHTALPRPGTSGHPVDVSQDPFLSALIHIPFCFFLFQFSRQCLELLDYLGVPYVQSKGEAEAMCALLNQRGVNFFCALTVHCNHRN